MHEARLTRGGSVCGMQRRENDGTATTAETVDGCAGISTPKAPAFSLRPRATADRMHARPHGLNAGEEGCWGEIVGNAEGEKEDAGHHDGEAVSCPCERTSL